MNLSHISREMTREEFIRSSNPQTPLLHLHLIIEHRTTTPLATMQQVKKFQVEFSLYKSTLYYTKTGLLICTNLKALPLKNQR